MSVTQLRLRKSAVSQRDLPAGLMDALDTEIRFAQAIELAIMGEAGICGFDCSDLCTLTTIHRERLEAIAGMLGGAS
jgi:hypothetical protein